MERIEDCLRREIKANSHLAGRGFGIVGKFEKFAAEGGDGGFGLECHSVEKGK